MQTNLLAPADGTVAEVLVSAGEAVEAGDLIISSQSTNPQRTYEFAGPISGSSGKKVAKNKRGSEKSLR